MAEADDWITPADEADDWITPPDEAVSTAPQASAGVSVNVSPDRLARKSLVPIPQPRPPEAPQAPAADDWLAPREPVPFTAQSTATPSLIPPEPAAPAPAPTAQSPESSGLPLANFDRFQPGYQPQEPNAPLTEGQPDGREIPRMDPFSRGMTEATRNLAAAFGDWKIEKDKSDPDHVDRLLETPISKGWDNPDWWTTHLAYGFGGTAPGFLAAAAGTAVGGPLGGAAGFAATSGLQALAPAYSKAIEEGLDKDAAAERAWKVAGIDAAVGGILGTIPGGASAQATLKQAILTSLKNMGVKAPAVMVAGEAAKHEVEGTHITPEEALQTAALGGATGLILSAPHLATAHGGERGAAPGRSTPGEVEDFLGRAEGMRSRAEIDEFLRQKAAREAAGGEQRALPAPEAEQPAEPAPAVDIKVNPPTAETSETAQTAALRAYGYTDDQIAAMSPRQRAAEYKDAVDSGVVPKGAESALSGEPPSNEGAKSVEADDWITPLGDPDLIGPDEQGIGDGSPEQYADRLNGRPDNLFEPTPGTRSAPVDIKSAEDVADAAAAGDQDHTPAQGEANNAQRGHAKWQGLDITFEAPAGGVRRGLTPEGETWEQGFAHAHGYIKGTKGADGDALDISFGDHPDTATEAYVVNERDAKTGRFRQTKSFVGFHTQDEVVQAYLGMEGKTREMIRDVVPMPVAEFKDWVRNGDHTKPIPPLKTVNVKPRVKRTGPQSLLEFIAANGGIRPDDPLIADVRQILGANNKFIPGVGPVIRKGGKFLDKQREAAVEASYMRDTPFKGGEARTTVADLLNLMDEEARGRKQYSEGNELTQLDEKSKARFEEGEQQLADARDHVTSEIAKHEIADAHPQDVDRAARYVLTDGMDPVDAYDRAVMEAIRKEELLTDEQIDTIGIRDDFDALASAETESGRPSTLDERQDGVAPGEGEGSALRGPDGETGERAGQPDEQRSADQGNEHAAPVAEGAGRAEGLAPATERTPAGEQAVIPGAEKIGQGQQAQRKADQPLKPKVNQKPADEGLFGDSAAQTDLVDMARKPAVNEIRPTVRGFADTRGQGRRFHGAPSEISGFDEGHYGSSVAYYGAQGFYTTDALDVAHGYANRRNASAPSIYEVKETKPTKIYDMEAPISAEVRAHLDGMTEDRYGSTADLVQSALDENPKNLREFFDEVRGYAASERIPADEVQEGVFHPIMDFLEAQGFDGMRHIGGLKTKTPQHDVVIYFNPGERVSLRKLSAGEVARQAEPPEPAQNIPENIPEAPKAGPSDSVLPEGFKVRARKQTNGGETFSLYQKGKGYVGTFPTEAEAIAAAKPKPAKAPTPAAEPDRPLAPKDNAVASVAKSVPGLYSAVARAVENVKLTKAPPAQWLSTIRNAPGVKAEEMQWLGLEDWLKEQTGAVTKDDVLGYVRANQIEVKEVGKGGRLTATSDEQAALMDALDKLERDGDLGDPNADVQGKADDLMNGALDGHADAIGDLEALGIDERLISPFRDRERAPTKFHSYTLPGGENYRELLLTLPPAAIKPTFGKEVPFAGEGIGMWEGRQRVVGVKEIPFEIAGTDGVIRFWPETPRGPKYVISSAQIQNAQFDTFAEARNYIETRWNEHKNNAPGASRQDFYKSPHWDEPNVLSHVRFNDRTIDGKKTLFLEEIQSDWHQAGKRKGYAKDTKGWTAQSLSAPDAGFTHWQINDANGDPVTKIVGGTAESAIRKAAEGIPEAPFKTTWPELAMKRIIRMAAEQGYDKIAWTDGATQAERYDLSKQIKEVRWNDTSHDLQAKDHTGKVVMREGNVAPDKLADYIGKEAAEKLINSPTGKNKTPDETVHILSGLDLKVGGEGMLGFYDDILPSTVNKLVKKFGGRVGRGELPGTGQLSARYEGPEPTAAQIAEVERAANVPPRERVFNSPITGQRQELQINRVANSSAVRIVRERMQSEGMSFGEAMAIDGHQNLADIFGGKIEQFREPTAGRPVHTLDITPPIRDAALGQGFPMFRLGELTPAGQQRQADIQQMIRDVIDRLVGPTVEVRFTDAMGKADHPGWGQYGQGKDVTGRYIPAERLIELSLANPEIASTALHESFHDIEAHLFTARELELAQRETPRLRQIVRDRFGYSEAEVEGMAGYEIRAQAFEIYSADRLNGKTPLGLHVGLRRVFDRIMRLLRAIRNGLNRLGFHTIEDLFGKAFEGKYRERQSRHEAPLSSVKEAASVARGKETLRESAERAIDLWDEARMKVAPMAVGSTESIAAAKDFANAIRLARHRWSRFDERLQQNFTPERRRVMWEAADRESVARQLGREPEQGLESLNDSERAVVTGLQHDAERTWKEAQAVGIVEDDGLPSYVPRMMVRMNEEGRFEHGAPDVQGYPGNPEGIGRGFKTTTGQTKQRKYMTAAETEAAMKARFGESAQIAKDIRALPLATSKLKEAIAARALINKIKSVGNLAGARTVSEGAEPNDGQHWFTLDHPAFKTYRPVLEKNPETGRFEHKHYDDGTPAFERVPIYIRSDFKGPLLAVLGKDTGKVYQAVMTLKGKAMSVIMYSPVIHNMVEWSRSLPAYPLKVASTWIYWQGNRAKNDTTTMNEAILSGLVPIGKRFFNQDITSIMEEPNIAPGRSWTAQVLSFVPGLFNPSAGASVKRAVDKAGNFWHNTLLWDRVADLQMGLYVNMRDDLVRKGHDAQTAGRVAAHFANRYAGALPLEAMSVGARKFANLLLFSRTFTLGNLGAMKDMLTGLPKDVQAQIERDIGPRALGKVKNFARRKALAIIMLDIALGIITTSILADILKKMTTDRDWFGEDGLFADYGKRFAKMIEDAGKDPASAVLHPLDTIWKLSSTATNEPGKQSGDKARVLLYRDRTGRGVYGRNPLGKIGEEFVGWPTAPGDMLMRKLGTFARPALQSVLNDRYAGAGFDRPSKIWRPDPHGWEWFKNAGRIALHFVEAQAPADAIHSAYDLAAEGKKDPRTNMLKIAAPFAGISISQGHPKGYTGAVQEQRRQQKYLDKTFGR